MVLLLAAELACRALQPSGRVPYSLDGVGEYRSLGPELEAVGAAPISVVGSSRAREAVLLPLVRLLMAERTGSEPRVANYAIAGAHAGEVALVVDRLLAADPPPEIVLYGLTPRQLVDKGAPRNSAYLWNLDDWWAERNERGRSVDRFLPQVLRNQLVRRVRLYRYREEIAAAFATPASESFVRTLRRGLAERDSDESPMRGDLTDLQRGESIRSRRVSDAYTREYVARIWLPDAWSMTEQERKLASLVEACRVARVPIVLFEVPISEVLLRNLPEGAYASFLTIVSRVSSESGVPFYSARDLELHPLQKDFREQSHLNNLGGMKVTRALVAEILVPWTLEAGL